MHSFWMYKFRKGLGCLLGKECLTTSTSFKTPTKTHVCFTYAPPFLTNFVTNPLFGLHTYDTNMVS